METHEQLQPKVGVGVLICKDGKILLGKRRGAHGEGEYQVPGGHLDSMESLEDCARREVAEECGVEIDNVRFQCVANIKQYAPKHYVLVGFVADWSDGEPRILEPEKCESWGWFDVNNLPAPLFAPVSVQVEAYKTGKNFFDA